jgi:hypothetical protein
MARKIRATSAFGIHKIEAAIDHRDVGLARQFSEDGGID